MGSLRDGEESLGFLNAEELRKGAGEVADFVAEYYNAIESYPACSPAQPGYLSSRLPEKAPDKSPPLDVILQDVRKHILPGLTHWQSPNFFAYFQANASTAAFLGEMLCSGFNVLESLVMDWMGGMLNLPSSFMFHPSDHSRCKIAGGGGVILGSTCEAIICTLVAARDKALNNIGYENLIKLVVYGSDQTHSCLQKACRIAGINPGHCRLLNTSSATGFALSPEIARKAVASDAAAGLIPLFLCATVGTTGLGAVDPLDGLAQIAREYKVWLHVDAAYAGSACICPEFRSYLDGVEHADSVSTNPHKWLLTNMDCCCLWVKHASLLVNALSTGAAFLDNPATASQAVVDYKDWQIALSRRFRAIKLWVVIRSHGLNNLREHIRRHVGLARLFEELVSMDERFEIVAPRRFALLCFRLKPEGGGGKGFELNRRLLEAVNSTGRIYMTRTVVEEMYVLRFAVGSTLTEERHVRRAWNIIQEQAGAVCAEDATSVTCECNEFVFLHP
ncbi:unnamed protein product [Victoria cruziana]